MQIDSKIKGTPKHSRTAKSPQTIAFKGIFGIEKHGTTLSVVPCCDGGDSYNKSEHLR